MFDTLLQAICKVGIFMICAQAVIHFRPREAYEKYLKLLVSVMILLQLLLPVGSFLLGDGAEKTAERLETFREELEQELERAAREAADADRTLENMTLEEILRRLEEQNPGAAGRSEEERGTERQSGEGEAIDGYDKGENGSKETEDQGRGEEASADRKKSSGMEKLPEEQEAASSEGIPEVTVEEISVVIE
ncbi:MAG: hypothetical protein NC432_00550 [Roseburia sp.]|nr:hypothetical protein [Roseburia sp.]MCM1098324.1 hypothetical protein [Ruminococcus flavefaciens]